MSCYQLAICCATLSAVRFLLASQAAQDKDLLHIQVAEHQMRMKDGRTGREEMTISRHIGNKVGPCRPMAPH